MAEMLIQSESLTPIADQIRVLSGTEDNMSLSNMVEYVGDANENIDYQNALIAQIQSALQNKITGVKLPTLLNPAASTDLVYGKQLINQNGTVVTGSIIDAEEVVF